MAKRGWLAQLSYVVVWLLLAALTAVVAWQLHVTLLYLASLMIANPTWRPPGWSADTVATLSRLSVVIWGSLCLIIVMYLEHRLREALKDGELLRQSLRFAIGLGVVSMTIYLITG